VSGVQHAVDVSADTLFEAAALGFQALLRDGWVEPLGPATRLEIEVRNPSVRHEVTVQQVRRWAEGAAASPAERLRKERVLAMLP
jgi:hypothetical protein